MKKYLLIAAVTQVLFGCATNDETVNAVPIPASSPRDKAPKSFCYAHNTAYSEGATWHGKTCKRDSGPVTVGVTNNLIWR